MKRILIETLVRAPIERVFDLSRSIDLHRLSTAGTREEAIAGVTNGLIGAGEEVTWRATHFFIRQTLSVRITEFDRPKHFRDEMVRGAFAKFAHDHDFTFIEGVTVMRDWVEVSAPGIFSSFLEPLLEWHLRKLLLRRNAVIRRVAEGEEWREFLDDDSATKRVG